MSLEEGRVCRIGRKSKNRELDKWDICRTGILAWH